MQSSTELILLEERCEWHASWSTKRSREVAVVNGTAIPHWTWRRRERGLEAAGSGMQGTEGGVDPAV